GAPGNTTPLVASMVAMRFVEFLPPKFFSEKFMVTVSPGSATPLVGRQDSDESATLTGMTEMTCAGSLPGTRVTPVFCGSNQSISRSAEDLPLDQETENFP